MSEKDDFIATLMACYFGDRNAFEKVLRIYDEKVKLIKDTEIYIKNAEKRDGNVKDNCLYLPHIFEVLRGVKIEKMD